MVTGVLMSIKPAYAAAIFDGTKTVELRRRRPSFETGTCVVVYSSSPKKAVCGTFKAGGVISDKPDDLWDLVGDRSGVDRDTFDAYFAGTTTAYAIEVESPIAIAPIPLGFRPPQSYLFLRDREPDHSALIGLAGEAA